MKKLEIEITNKGEDYISVMINGDEKELHIQDGEAIISLLKVIKKLHSVYA
jgi:hypothetical protein